MILCDRPCSNKSEYGYCNTTYCINPVIPNTVVGYFPPPRLIKTNADRIRSMTDEELAEFIEGAVCPPQCCVKRVYECQKNDCVPCWLAWLREEVKDV